LRQGFGTAWTLARELGSPQNYFARFLKLYRASEPVFFDAQICPSPAQSMVLGAQTLASRQILDVQRLSLPTLLRYEDSNSMHHSIESRMPFLDYRVMEFGLALPLEHKLHHGFGKYILRKIAEPLLPESIVWDRNKRAFSLHPTAWLSKGLGAHLFKEVQSNRNFLHALLSESTRRQIQDENFFLQRKNFTKMTTLAYLIRQRSVAGDA